MSVMINHGLKERFNMTSFVADYLGAFEEIKKSTQNMDYFLLDNYNTTWYHINNPVPFVYVRKTEPLVMTVTVNKDTEKEKMKNET
jgi:hypothetical protein